MSMAVVCAWLVDGANTNTPLVVPAALALNVVRTLSHVGFPIAANRLAWWWESNPFNVTVVGYFVFR